MTKKLKIAFQGEAGANSHIAITEAYPDAEPLASFGRSPRSRFNEEPPSISAIDEKRGCGLRVAYS